ncbi:MAG: hypothetical protein ACOX0F_00600 [Syntrophomonadaceae bacterium]|jgi:hypothetical protein
MNDVLRLFIIVVLIYYLIKGLLYLLFWQASMRVEERGKEMKRRRIELREKRRQRAQQKDQE